MAAQTATNRIGKATVARLAGLQRELAGGPATNIDLDATTTVTLVYTTATGAITVDVAVT